MSVGRKGAAYSLIWMKGKTPHIEKLRSIYLIPRILIIPLFALLLFLSKTYLVLFYVHKPFDSMYVCMLATYVPGACRDKRRASDSLELQLKMGVSCHVVSGN